MNQAVQTTELLAPAGNAEALRAAVRAGADAVYLGLESFNARRGADNFTVEALREACIYAHARGVNVYVTLNTVVLPEEVEKALECARQAYRAGADAFIVQDLGIAAELSRSLPEARLHISTQMNTHNEAGIRAAAALGAKRVTLARELSLPEIEHLVCVARESNMEVETFVHGAICVCYSGQCFMSSLIGGRSANRGMCAQACRLPYELYSASKDEKVAAPGEHLLSPQDLCAIDLLSSLVDAGVSSFKIEGRMKSPEYVFAVVSVYRAVLDRILARDEHDSSAVLATEDEKRSLAEAFSRGFTTAYLEGERGNDMMSYKRPNNRGVFIGRVAEVRNGVAFVTCDRPVVNGDVLEFWTGKGHAAQNVSDVFVDSKGRTRISLDGQCARSVRTGDRVFRVRSAEAAFEDEAQEPRIAVTGSVVMRLGEPLRIAFSLASANECKSAARLFGDEAGLVAARHVAERLSAKASSLEGIAEGPVVEPAKTRAVAEEDVRAHVDRLGTTPFKLVNLNVELDEGAGIGFSQLHHVRAEALDDLLRQLTSDASERILPRVEKCKASSAHETKGCRVAVWATNPACARAAKRAGADIIYVPALNYGRGEAMSGGHTLDGIDQAGYPKQTIVALPVVDHDAIAPSREAAVGFDSWNYVESGKPVLAESFASLVHALDHDALPEVGPHIPVVNRLSLGAVASLGVSRVWLSPELTLAQIRSLGEDSPVELGITVFGPQELMVCEHCLLMSQGPCNQKCDSCQRRKVPHYLKDRKGFDFPAYTDACGRSHILNSVDLDTVPALPELLAAGVSSFMVDATLMNAEETAQAVGRLVRALRIAQDDGNTVAKMPNTTSGHLFRGVS